MKIEKISDTQVKFLLNKTDLNERDIKLTELAYGSEKTQELFREMMDQALKECGFQVENAPLMIEAIPVTMDSIMIIVTKVSNADDVENKFNLLPRAKDNGRFKKKGLLDVKDDKSNKTNIFIYSFTALDDVINLSKRLYNFFSGESAVYKSDKLYFLVLENAEDDDLGIELDALMSEYGQKHVAGVISKYYLVEHGEPLINNSAIHILANI